MRLDLFLNHFPRLVLDYVGSDSETQTNRGRLGILLVCVVIHVERRVDCDACRSHLEVEDVSVRPALKQVLELDEGLTAVCGERSIVGREELLKDFICRESNVVNILREDLLVGLHLKLVGFLSKGGLA